MKTITRKLLSSLFTSTFLLTPLSLLSGEVSTNTTDLGFFVAEDPTKVNSGGDSTSNLYKLSSDGSVTLLKQDIFPDVSTNSFTSSNFTIDESKGKIYFLEDQRSEVGQEDIENTILNLMNLKAT